MDEQRFDDLTTSLSNANSRREALRGVAAGGLAAGIAVFGFGRNEAAAKKKKRHKRCKISQNTVLSLPLLSGGGPGALGDACAGIATCATGLACDNGKCKACVGTCGIAPNCCVGGVCLTVTGVDLPVCAL